ATYAYDPLGHRKSKMVGATTTLYVTDASNRAVLDYDGVSGAVLRWYAFGSGPNEVLSQVNVATSSRATFIPTSKVRSWDRSIQARALLPRQGISLTARAARRRARSATPARASMPRPT